MVSSPNFPIRIGAESCAYPTDKIEIIKEDNNIFNFEFISSFLYFYY